ncbi:MAG TPA: hypothetical protein VFC47_11265 [Caulobacteraceae bacterium]|nr:hypothetical protein [Caulobacteraceae bacterium]
MPGFAVSMPIGDAEVESQITPGFDRAPIPFWDAVQSSFDDGVSNQRLGAREQALDDAFTARNRDIEGRVGAQAFRGVGSAAGLDQDIDPATGVPSLYGDVANAASFANGYGEQAIDALRAKYPAQMAGVPTAAQVQAGVDTNLNAIAARAQAGAAQHPFGAFLGGSGAQLTDPVNLAVGAATGGLMEGAPLALRVLAQSGIWGGVAAAEAPGKALEAGEVGGPAYGLPEAISDIVGGAVSGGAFELGATALKAVLSPIIARAMPAIRKAFAGDDAARGALNVLDQAGRDDMAIGPTRSGSDYETGLTSLETGSPPPIPAPDRDVGDLFGPDPVNAIDAATRAPFVDPQGGAQGAALYERAEYRGRAIYSGTFDPAAIGTDPATFQYKSDGDAQGVTDRLKGVQAWDPTSSGKVIVYQDETGALTIADGHQRLALANRMGEQGFEARLDGYLFRQADGWSPAEVRTIAALKNIREGQGSALDAAKVFRANPATMNDDSLPLTGEVVRQGKGLARLSSDALGAVINKVIPERYGAIIGQLAGDRPDLHSGMVKLLHAGEPANLDEAHALVQEAQLDDWLQSEGAQSDLFGDTPAQSVAIGRAKLRAWLLRNLRGDSRLYGQLTKHADAIEAGGNVLARDANEASLATSNAALEQIAKLGMRAGDLGDAMTAAAREITDGRPIGEAGKGLLARVKSAIANGEKIDAGRSGLLDPAVSLPPSDAAARAFDEVGGKGQAGQIAAKPEDAEREKFATPDDLRAVAEKIRAQREASQVEVGRLWSLEPDRLQAMLEEKTTSDHDKVVQAFGGEAEAKEFERLDRKRNSTDPRRADEGSREFDTKYGELTADQDRLVYGIGETDAQEDDIRQILDAHQDIAEHDPHLSDDRVAYWGAVGARRATAEELAKVPEGTATPTVQAAFVRMSNAYRNLVARGVDPGAIPDRMVEGLVASGQWRPEQAREVIGGFVRDMQRLAADRTERAPPERVALTHQPGAASSPLVRLSGEEIAPRSTPLVSLREAVNAYFERVLRPLKVESRALGAEVGFSTAGLKKVRSHSANPDTLRLFAGLPDIIRDGDLVGSEPPRDPGAEPSTRAYHTLEAPVEIAGRPLTARVTIRETNRGRFHYDHVVLENEDPAPGARSDPGSKPGGGTPEGEASAGNMGGRGDQVNEAGGSGSTRGGDEEPWDAEAAKLDREYVARSVAEIGERLGSRPLDSSRGDKSWLDTYIEEGPAAGRARLHRELPAATPGDITPVSVRGQSQGLFDDIPDATPQERAFEHLKSCAPE